ncbi:Uncharacterised protein [Shigella sonnei]|nr:Uncharacterised protein [Shigella sonnei]CST12123.1 Uncharacterised protein [Shigella sonnei]
MPQLVIRITAQPQPFLHLKTDGDFRVGVLPADHQDDGVKENERIEQRR